MNEEPMPRFGVRFDPTVNAGHLLTTVALLVSLVVWGVRLESRVDHEADLRARIERRMDEESSRDKDAQKEIKDSLRRMEDKIDRIQERAGGGVAR